VDAGQAQRTGLAVSRPDGGLVSYGVGGALIRPLDRRRSVTLFGGVDRLGGEPAGTSLIRERGQRMQFTVGLGYGMRFGL
jgi:outer membrane scaffolding protein for murein synthesis (MipA/OmpV family)